MGGSQRNSKKPGPSYEDGRLRDPEIEKKIDPKAGRDGLLRLIKKAVHKSAH